MTTKVKVIDNVTIHSGNKTYGMGSVFDYEGDAVDKLVEAGFVEIIGAPAQNGAAGPEKPPKAEGKK
jgi:hypothetical protein